MESLPRGTAAAYKRGENSSSVTNKRTRGGGDRAWGWRQPSCSLHRASVERNGDSAVLLASTGGPGGGGGVTGHEGVEVWEGTMLTGNFLRSELS